MTMTAMIPMITAAAAIAPTTRMIEVLTLVLSVPGSSVVLILGAESCGCMMTIKHFVE